MKQKPKEKTETPKKLKAADDQLQQLKDRMEQLQQQKDEVFSKLQRVSADYANFQKRASRQIADSTAYEKEKIIKSILPVLDNFEHTLANAHKSEGIDVLIKGVRIIYDQMLDILKSHGAEQIKAVGEIFDPALHQAMLQKYVSEKNEGVVLEEFQKGYRLNGRVIRPSKVVVNKKTPESEVQQQPDLPRPGNQTDTTEQNQTEKLDEKTEDEKTENTD